MKKDEKQYNPFLEGFSTAPQGPSINTSMPFPDNPFLQGDMPKMMPAPLPTPTINRAEEITAIPQSAPKPEGSTPFGSQEISSSTPKPEPSPGIMKGILMALAKHKPAATPMSGRGGLSAPPPTIPGMTVPAPDIITQAGPIAPAQIPQESVPFLAGPGPHSFAVPEMQLPEGHKALFDATQGVEAQPIPATKAGILGMGKIAPSVESAVEGLAGTTPLPDDWYEQQGKAGKLIHQFAQGASQTLGIKLDEREQFEPEDAGDYVASTLGSIIPYVVAGKVLAGTNLVAALGKGGAAIAKALNLSPKAVAALSKGLGLYGSGATLGGGMSVIREITSSLQDPDAMDLSESLATVAKDANSFGAFRLVMGGMGGPLGEKAGKAFGNITENAVAKAIQESATKGAVAISLNNIIKGVVSTVAGSAPSAATIGILDAAFNYIKNPDEYTADMAANDVVTRTVFFTGISLLFNLMEVPSKIVTPGQLRGWQAGAQQAAQAPQVKPLDKAFETLGVRPGASFEEIKSAHRNLAMQFHPDRNIGDATAQARMVEINEAWKEIIKANNLGILSHPAVVGMAQDVKQAGVQAIGAMAPPAAQAVPPSAPVIPAVAPPEVVMPQGKAIVPPAPESAPTEATGVSTPIDTARPNTVFREIVDFNGNPLGVEVEPYDGTKEGARKAAQLIENRLDERYPDWSNINSRIGATDAEGAPKFTISPNLRNVSDVRAEEGAARHTWGDIPPTPTAEGTTIDKAPEIGQTKGMETVEKIPAKKNIGYHAGDLGKAESLINQYGSRRGTGHFGTGTYFVGDKSKIDLGTYKDRPVHEVDFSDYKLFRPSGTEDGRRVHDFLKYLNDGRYELAKEEPISQREVEDAKYAEPDEAIAIYKKHGLFDEEDFEEAVGMTVQEFMESKADGPKFNRYFDRLQSRLERKAEGIEDAKRDISRDAFSAGLALGISEERLKEITDAVIGEVEGEIERIGGPDRRLELEGLDSASTRLMKRLGYEGVDVRHLPDLDNTEYGSVIYDLKKQGDTSAPVAPKTPTTTPTVAPTGKETAGVGKEPWEMTKEEYTPTTREGRWQLVGSRARGDFTETSDRDYLTMLTPEEASTFFDKSGVPSAKRLPQEVVDRWAEGRKENDFLIAAPVKNGYLVYHIKGAPSNPSIYRVSHERGLGFLTEKGADDAKARELLPKDFTLDTPAGISHKLAVEKAIKEGKEIPPEVLAEYPELTAKPEVKAETPLETAVKPMAQRITLAENSFMENVMEQFGFTEPEARKILEAYKKVKVVKLDPVNGQYELKDGRFWEKAPMEEALRQATPTPQGEVTLYHGTNKADLTAFQGGSWFSTSKEFADKFAEGQTKKRKGVAKTYTVKVDLGKLKLADLSMFGIDEYVTPLQLAKALRINITDIRKAYDKDPVGKELTDSPAALRFITEMPSFTDLLKSKGYQGITAKEGLKSAKDYVPTYKLFDEVKAGEATDYQAIKDKYRNRDPKTMTREEHIERLDASMANWRRTGLDKEMPEDYAIFMAQLQGLKDGLPYKITSETPEEMIRGVGSLIPQVNRNAKDELIPVKGDAELTLEGKKWADFVEKTAKDAIEKSKTKAVEPKEEGKPAPEKKPEVPKVEPQYHLGVSLPTFKDANAIAIRKVILDRLADHGTPEEYAFFVGETSEKTFTKHGIYAKTAVDKIIKAFRENHRIAPNTHAKTIEAGQKRIDQNKVQKAKQDKPKAEVKPDPPVKVEETVKKGAATTTAKITDFGEKIGGAKKDTWANRDLTLDDLNNLTDREADKFVTKDNIWKKLNYEQMVAEGMEPHVAYLIKKARDALPAKVAPTTNVEKNKQNREKYIEFIGIARDAISEVQTESDFRKLFDKIFVDAGYFDPSLSGYSRWTQKAKDNPFLTNPFIKRVQLTGWTLTDAKRFVEKTGFPGKVEQWRKDIKITQVKDGEWAIARKSWGNSYQILAGEFDSKEAANKYLEEELKPRLQKGGDKAPEPVIPQLANIERKGTDFRGGKDVTGQDLLDTFGFRGGEFGNWNTQAERQASLNFAYDALMDQAEVLGISPKDLSLNGELGIAFGARGSGGKHAALAHYEPSKVVINLTKMNGAGSLSHELWHAIDDHLGRLSGDKTTATPYASDGLTHKSKLNEEVKAAVSKLIDAVTYTEKTADDVVKDAEKLMSRTQKNIDAYLKPVLDGLGKETSGYRYDRKQKKHVQATLRSATAKEMAQVNKWVETIKTGADVGPTLDKLSALNKEVKGRVIDKETVDNIGNWANMMRSVNKSLEEAKAGKASGRKASDFLTNAKEIDKETGRSKPYWSQTKEMLARAFAAFTEDNLAGESQYLVHSSSNKGIYGDMKPYPEGEERRLINRAFNNLFSSMVKAGYFKPAVIEKAGEAAKGLDAKKEPWEMTQAEFVEYSAKETGLRPDARSETGTGTHREVWERGHKVMVKKQIEKGASIPPEVLKDYPELAKVEAKPTPLSTAKAKDLFHQTLAKDLQFAKNIGAKASEISALKDMLTSLRSDYMDRVGELSGKDLTESAVKKLAKDFYNDAKDLLQTAQEVAAGEPTPDVVETAKWLRQQELEAEKVAPSLAQRIKARGGIAPPHKDVWQGEYRETVPLHLKNKNGLPMDEMAEDMGMTVAEMLEALGTPKPGKIGPVSDYYAQAQEMIKESSIRGMQNKLGKEIDEVIGDISPSMGMSVKVVGGISPRQKPGQKPLYESTDPDVEARIQAAHGMPTSNFWGKTKEVSDAFFRKLTREFEWLPHTAEFSQLRFDLKTLQKYKDIASDSTLRLQQGITIDFKDNPQTFKLFARKALLDDLVEEAKAGHDLPFGYTEDTLDADVQKLDAVISNYPEVGMAIDKRKKVWDAIKKDYITAQESIGHKVDEKFTRENYFRHQVLEYANVRGLTGTGQKLRTPTGRGFLKQREGSSMDINTNYMEAEYEVMSQMIYDIKRAQVIKMVKDNYDRLPSLKQKAKSLNHSRIMVHFDKLADAANKQIQDPDKGVTAEDMYRRILNKKQAMGFNKLSKMAENGMLPGSNMKKWSDAIDALASGDEDENTLAYLSWLLEKHGGTDAGNAAALVFKGIHEKNEYIRTTLGKKYATWESLVPEGYSLWQPKEGNYFYFADSIPAQLAEKLYAGALNQVGIGADDIRKVLSKGQKLPQFVVKEEIAKTLDNLVRNRPVDPVRTAARSLLLKWKKYQLISPTRLVRYNIRNITGDAEAAFIGNPRVFAKVSQATKELYNVFWGDKSMSATMQDWFERGGMQSTLQAQEMGDINRLKMFKNMLEAEGTIKEIPVKVIQGYWEKARLSTDFREALLRYAAYLQYLDEIKADINAGGAGRPKGFGGSLREEVMALSDIKDRAFQLSNDLLGAYDTVGVIGQELREGLMPFWSWKEVNAKRYWRFLKNAAYDDELAATVGRSVSAAAKRSPVIALRIGTFVLKALALWAILQTYNNTRYPEEEKALSSYIREKPHIILGKDANGKTLYFDRLGILGDLLEWFTMDSPYLLAKDYLNGKKTLADVAKQFYQAPINVLAQSLGPQYKMPVEMLTKKKLFPDIWEPGSVRDGWLYLAQNFGLGDLYAKVKGLPQRPDAFARLLVGVDEPGQAAYFDILSEKREYQKSIGKFSYFSSEGNEKSKALYNVKLSARYGDATAFRKYLIEYATHGGTKDGLQTSLRNMNPLHGLNDEQKKDFVNNWLDEDGIEMLVKAMGYYEDVIQANTVDFFNKAVSNKE